MTLVRRQTLPDRAAEHRFKFTADPVCGYRVDAGCHVFFKELPKDGKGKPAGFQSGAFCPWYYTPWEETAIRQGSTPFEVTGKGRVFMDDFELVRVK